MIERRCQCSCQPGSSSVLGTCECGDESCRAAFEMCMPCWYGKHDQCRPLTADEVEVYEREVARIAAARAKQ